MLILLKDNFIIVGNDGRFYAQSNYDPSFDYMPSKTCDVKKAMTFDSIEDAESFKKAWSIKADVKKLEVRYEIKELDKK